MVWVATSLSHDSESGKEQYTLLGMAAKIKKLRAGGHWAALKEELMTEWKRSADEVLAGKKNYASRYKASIKIETKADSITFRVTGFEALKIEYGWGPPQGGDVEDGVGEYTGTLQDMRSFMGYRHTSEAKGKGKSRKPALSYSHVRMGMFKGIPELVQEASDQLIKTRFDGYSDRTAKKYAKGFSTKLENALNHLSVGGKGLSDKWDKRLPTHTNAAKRSHLSPLLSRVFKFKKKSATSGGMATWRTITNSTKQRNRKLWWTRGVAPNNVLDKTQDAFVSLIVRHTVAKLGG